MLWLWRNFPGMTAYDAHRTGESGTKQRRCLTDDELLALGWTHRSESVTCYREGVTLEDQMDTWRMPVNEEEQARLAAMRERGKVSLP